MFFYHFKWTYIRGKITSKLQRYIISSDSYGADP